MQSVLSPAQAPQLPPHPSSPHCFPSQLDSQGGSWQTTVYRLGCHVTPPHDPRPASGDTSGSTATVHTLTSAEPPPVHWKGTDTSASASATPTPVATSSPSAPALAHSGPGRSSSSTGPEADTHTLKASSTGGLGEAAATPICSACASSTPHISQSVDRVARPSGRTPTVRSRSTPATRVTGCVSTSANGPGNATAAPPSWPTTPQSTCSPGGPCSALGGSTYCTSADSSSTRPAGINS